MRARQSNVDLLKAALDFDLRKVERDDLNLSPLLATVFARLHYKLKPESIPQTLRGRAGYWKKYSNIAVGKGSVEKYIARVKPFQVFLMPFSNLTQGSGEPGWFTSLTIVVLAV